MWQADGQDPRVSVFTDSLIDMKAGGKPEVSPSESKRRLSSFCSSKAPSKVHPAPGLELHLKLGGLEEPTLPMDVEGEPARAELGCLASGAWLVSGMLGNKNGEGRKKPRLVMNIKTINIKVLDLKIYPGKHSLMQKSGSLKRIVWSRHRKEHLLYGASRLRFSKMPPSPAALHWELGLRSSFAQEPRGGKQALSGSSFNALPCS